MRLFIEKIITRCKNLFQIIGGLFWLLAPFVLSLLSMCLIKIIWSLSFKDYLEFLKIIVWPITALIILFFLRKVITYLFLSIEGFNFFGARGELKNVQDLISEKVDEKFQQEKKQKEYNLERDKLLKELGNKDGVARKVIKLWKDSIEENKRLTEENKKLNEILERKNQFAGNTPFVLGESELGTGDKIDDLTLGNPTKRI